MMEKMDNSKSPIEFNSMEAILKRLNYFIHEINEARKNNDSKTMVENMICYFKEINEKLPENISEVHWKKLTDLRNKAFAIPDNPNSPSLYFFFNTLLTLSFIFLSFIGLFSDVN